MQSVLRPPGVLIEPFLDVEPDEPTRIDVPVFVVVAERGPIHAPTRITSWPHFVATFGSFIATGFGAYAAKAFFDNGGRAVWVVRVAAPATATTTDLGAPQPAERLSSIVVDTAGLVVGAAATLTQGDLRRTYLVTAVDEITKRVTWDRSLHPDFNLAATIDVGSGTAAADTELPGSGGPSLHIEAAAPGIWGNHLTVTTGPGRPASTTNRPADPSNLAFAVVASTVGFEPGTSVTLSQDLAGVLTTADRVVARCDRANNVLEWDSALPAAFDVTKLLSIQSRPFTLTVSEHGAVREVFSELQIAPGGSRHVADVLNSSALVRATVVAPRVPLTRTARLGGGRDGVAALTTGDFLGDDLLALAAGATGMLGLATTVDLEEPAAVAIPDLVAPAVEGVVLDVPSFETDPCWPCQPPPQPPPADDVEVFEARHAFSLDQVLAAQSLLVDHCTRNGERIALLDPPGGDGILGVDDLVGRAFQLASDRAVLVAPWIALVDPLLGASRAPSRVPPSAHYAGLIAAVDLDRGPWAAPANQALEWAHGLGARFDDDHHALLNEAGIVVLRAVAGLGVMPLGVRTLSGDPLWIFVTVRRTMIWLRRLMRHALAWTAFEPLNAQTVAGVVSLLDGLLADVWADGGLAGSDPREAFFVHPRDAAETPDGQFICTVGVALARPAEFITVQVRRAGNRLELTEQPERGSWP